MADAAASSSEEDDGPDHDPVYFDYTQGKEMYKITTFNFGGLRNGDYEMVIEALNSDIVCCQEINKKLPLKIQQNYHCISGSSTKLKTLVNKKTFPDKPKEEVKEDIKKLIDNLKERQCTVRLDTFIVISWHGKHKIKPAEKEKHFNDLQTYARALSKNYKLPVIIGGDFNLKNNEAAKHSNPEGPTALVAPHKIKRKRNIDYFHVVFQQFEAISTPYKDLMAAHASSSTESVTSQMEKLEIGEPSCKDVICPNCSSSLSVSIELQVNTPNTN